MSDGVDQPNIKKMNKHFSHRNTEYKKIPLETKLSFLLQLLAGLHKTIVFVAQQKCVGRSYWLCTWNIDHFRRQLGSSLKIFSGPS